MKHRERFHHSLATAGYSLALQQVSKADEDEDEHTKPQEDGQRAHPFEKVDSLVAKPFKLWCPWVSLCKAKVYVVSEWKVVELHNADHKVESLHRIGWDD